MGEERGDDALDLGAVGAVREVGAALDHVEVRAGNRLGDAAGHALDPKRSDLPMWGKRLNDWKTIPTSARSLTRLARFPEIDWPCTRISPFWIGSSRFTQRIRVLLPEPEGPQTTMTSPASTLRSTSVSTW